MRLAIAQRNPTVGALDANADLAVEAIEAARAADADVVLFSELFLCGYPPRDLLLHEGFLESCRAAGERVARHAQGIVAVVGCPWPLHDQDPRAEVANSLLVLRDGKIDARYDKRLLPTYDVFDEDRYFTPGDAPLVIDIAGVRVGLSVCEDLWRAEDVGFSSRYLRRPDPVAQLAAQGARVLLNASASPYAMGKAATQRAILRTHCAKHNIVVAEVNQLGANDHLIFDPSAAVYTPDPGAPGGARLIAAGKPFEEDMVVIDLPAPDAPEAPDPVLDMARDERLWRALVLGVRDYFRKTGFARAVLGLSGGIDSAVTACIAAAALGPANVLGVGMPSRYSSEGSVRDARELARRLGVEFTLVPIRGKHDAAESALREALAAQCERLGLDPAPGLTEENMQSRLRGLTIMAFANKLGALALTTGNKSEMAVGYATIYGDTVGALAVLADVLKTRVYALARWINANHALCGFDRAPIPDASITKPPSAELRPDQTDQDSLPPYDVLDAIVERYVEQRHAPARIIRDTGFDGALVRRIVRLIDINEYKRRQTPLGLKVSPVAFGMGRRLPIAQGWRPDRL